MTEPADISSVTAVRVCVLAVMLLGNLVADNFTYTYIIVINNTTYACIAAPLRTHERAQTHTRHVITVSRTLHYITVLYKYFGRSWPLQ